MSSDCETFRSQLGEYLYGEVTDAAALERHLGQCPACREELEAIRRALAAVDRAGLGSAPEGVVDAVIAGVVDRLRRRPAGARWWGRHLGWGRHLACPASAGKMPAPQRAVGRWVAALASLAACLLVGAFGAWLFWGSADNESAAIANRDLELQTKAVAAEAEAVLVLLQDLERENDVLVRLLGPEASDPPGAKSDGEKRGKESA